MKMLSYLRSLAGKLLHRSRVEDEMEDELRSHMEHRADDLMRSGLSRAEAERRARIEFGGQVRFQEESREAMGGLFVETLVQDVRFAVRVLRKSPGFTFAAIFTLALAIGANAVVFSVMNGLVLRPLNVPEAKSLYALERGSDNAAAQSYADYLDLRDRNRSFDGLAAYNIATAGLEYSKNASPAWAYEVSGNYFDVLKVQPCVGRFFHGSDEHGANSAPFVVLSYAYWHSHFQEDRGVVGRTVQVNKHPFVVLGVAPPEFRGTLLFFSPDFFVPMVDQEQIEGTNSLNARGTHWVFMVMGHLKAGVTPAQATADLNSIGVYLEKTYPKDDGKMTFTLARPSLYGDYLGRPVKAFVGALMLLAGLILLAACANLGSLFAARAADRSREVALRLALGAGRIRILRGLFTEAILISIVGGVLGLWGSLELLRGLMSWQPFPQFPISVPVNPDANVYAVALLLALASGLLFGAAPVRQVLRTSPYGVIKMGSTGWGSVGNPGRRLTIRDVLLAVQIAICAVLLTSSFVAVRGMVRSLHTDFGFEPRHSLLADIDLGMAGYRGDHVPAMQRRIIDATRTIPGVSSVGLIYSPPLANGRPNGSNVFASETTDMRPVNAAAEALMFSISPAYFQAAGTALLAGRDINWHDEKSMPRVATVNQEFARKLFGSAAKGLGAYFKMPDGTRIQVVGIVRDGKYSSLTEDPQPAMFFPIMQAPSSEATLVVRSNGDPRQLAAAIRSRLRELDAGLALSIQTRTETMNFVLFPSRVATVALSVLGIMGAMLSVTGIFGLAAYSVSKRLKELGIRMALGAQRKELLQAALGRAFRLLAVGSAVGLLLGILASSVLASIVYQATPRDPVVLGGVVLAMAALGLVASWIPARRVLSLAPLALLREE